MLSKAVPAKSICIIDTLNRASPGSDENASSDMGKLLAAVKKLEAENEGLVILCHHTGKDRSQGLRGHSSLHAAMDAEIELRRDEKLDTRSWRSSKVKDEKDGTGYGFRLVQHRLGFDTDGDPETSCTVEREVFLKQKPTPKGSAKKPAYDAITSLISQSSITGKANAPFTARCIKPFEFKASVPLLSLSVSATFTNTSTDFNPKFQSSFTSASRVSKLNLK